MRSSHTVRHAASPQCQLSAFVRDAPLLQAAEVTASTFDGFFAVANRPDIKARLPVVTKEIEDGWIHGVPSDPLKNAQFREARQALLPPPIPPCFPVLARACLCCLGAPSWVLTSLRA